MQDAIVEFFEGQQITIRPSDGYWNATEMCKRYGRKLNDFARLGSSKAYIEALSENTGIPALNLMELRKGRGQATWAHPRVALKIAAWLNPYFEVWVYSVIERLLTKGRVELQEGFDALLDALDMSEAQVKELLARSERLTLELSSEQATRANIEGTETDYLRARLELLENYIADRGLDLPE